jgi:4-aminobutyrate aminotransferase/(S)-3-amino-2-methylpropionate transaminase
MVYPSHYSSRRVQPARPNAAPGQTVDVFAARLSRPALEGRKARLTPWLQDFSLGRTYTLDDVRAQDCRDSRTAHHGYLLWNAEGLYNAPALLPLHDGYSCMQAAGAAAIVSAMAVTRADRAPDGDSGAEVEGDPRAEGARRRDPLSIFLPVVVDQAQGATLTDVDGNTFLDFTGGVGCLNVGHSHPQVVAAAQEQLTRFSHTDFTIVPYEVYVDLAERLCELAPVRRPAKAAFFNAGTEAVENAVKFARSYTGRPAVIGFEGGFHGRTLLSLTLTSKTHPYKAGLGPLRARGLSRAVPERVPRPERGRGARGARARVRDARRCRERGRDRDRAGSGRGWLPGGAAGVSRRRAADLRRQRDRSGGRRGADGVRPHRPALGHRALGHRARPSSRSRSRSRPGCRCRRSSGRREIMDAPGDSAIGGTYVGNPVAQAAALAVLDVFEEEGLTERAASIGETIRRAHDGVAGALGRDR